MPVRAAAGSRNSSRRCASPREIRTPGRWRRNRLAHSSIANRRLPRSDAPRSRRKPHSRRPWRAPSVSINKEIELGVRGRWPPPSECTICSDPASRSSSLSRGRLRRSPIRSGANMLRLLSAAMSPYSAQTMCPTQRQTRPRHTDRMRSRRRGDKTTPSQTRPGAARHCDGSHLLLFVLGDAR